MNFLRSIWESFPARGRPKPAPCCTLLVRAAVAATAADRGGSDDDDDDDRNDCAEDADDKARDGEPVAVLFAGLDLLASDYYCEDNRQRAQEPVAPAQREEERRQRRTR